MAPAQTPPVGARSLLKLAGTDPSSARRAMGERSIEGQVELICSAPIGQRPRLLSLAPDPEKLVPALPPAELCHIARAGELEESGWILEHATPEQIAACIDLDAWRDLRPDPTRFGSWLVALADAGETTLLRGVHAVDMEQLALHLKSRVAVVLKENNDDFEPPAGGQTLDGQFYVVPLSVSDDLEDLMTTLRVLFQRDYWFYFRLLQSVNWELQTETEEWAQRWRAGRLQDLGFPPWEEAMALYGYLRAERRGDLPEGAAPAQAGEWPLPVWMPQLPGGSESEHLLFRTIASLQPQERRSFLFAFVSLANKVAVADRMPLGEPESLPQAMQKAAGVASLGLEYVARVNHLEPADVLRRTSLDRLFRVGFNQDDSLEPPARLDDEPTA